MHDKWNKIVHFTKKKSFTKMIGSEPVQPATKRKAKPVLHSESLFSVWWAWPPSPLETAAPWSCYPHRRYTGLQRPLSAGDQTSCKREREKGS